jgi:hypothetical protein
LTKRLKDFLIILPTQAAMFIICSAAIGASAFFPSPRPWQPFGVAGRGGLGITPLLTAITH